MSARETRAATRVEVLVIGAGISGVGAAVRLLRESITDFVLLEKADQLGGTWRDNSYPGCACDVPSALYSYSFAQKSDWSRAFADRNEIFAYVQETAKRFGVLPHIRFGVDVTSARWDSSAQMWRVQTSNGNFVARSLVSCAGYLHEPLIPGIPGLDSFSGKIFHSSRWDHQHRLDGERVAVIGTGASAVQFVPKIQPKVKELILFQRTPQWVIPKPDHAVGSFEQRVLSSPRVLDAWRQTIWGAFELLGVGFRKPKLFEELQKLVGWNLRRVVEDPVLLAKLTPNYTIGCKRILMSNDYYPALCLPNVEVLSTGVREVRGKVVVGADGTAREVDTIILGTGFHVSDPPIAEVIRGTSGESLAEIWKGSPEAYRGTTITGFPNLYFVLGPNLGIGHNSAFVVIEAQLDYLIGGLRALRSNKLASLEVRAGAQRQYNALIQEKLQSTVWNVGGCSSYYIDRNGKNSIAFPWGTVKMRKLLGRFDLENYDQQKSASKRADRTERGSAASRLQVEEIELVG